MMKVIRAMTLLALGLLLPLTASAGLEDIRRDAEKGDAVAQYEMGVLYEFGFNLTDHEIDALAWYSISADRGNSMAADRRDLLKARLSAQQVEKAEQRRKELTAGMPSAPPAAPAPAPVVPEAPAAAPPAETPPAAPAPAAPASPPAAPASAPADLPPADSAPKP